MDQAVEEGVTILVVGEQAMSAAALGFASYGFGDPAVESLDEAVGLRVERFC